MYPVILALDTPHVEGLPLEHVAAVKIGWIPLLEYGPEIIRRLAPRIPVIVDVKLADVPHVAREIIGRLISRGACCVIAHGFLGESLRGLPLDSMYIVAKMTVPTLYDMHMDEVVLTALRLGARGLVLPANDPAAIRRVREMVGCGPPIISPGVGVQGAAPGDALKSGASFEIVGRFLFEDPGRIELWRGLRPTCSHPEP